MNNQNLLPELGKAIYYPSFFSKEESDYYFNALLNSANWKHETIKMFGKEILEPRLTALYGDSDKPYTYSKKTMIPNIWNEDLLKIKSKIEAVAEIKFTSALLNQYRHGMEYAGWHRDNEKMLGANPIIGSISFGASRIFKFRRYKTKDNVQSVVLNHGDFLLMSGGSQEFWEHSVPKTKKETTPRINLTFRVIQNS